MVIGSTGCCGTREITSLSSHKTAKEALEAFCRLHWKVDATWGAYNATIYTFYIFTAAVYNKADREKYTKKTPQYAHMYDLYGHNFAKLIRTNKLGKVWTSAAHINEAFHPDHQVKVWLWAPDKVALRAWWDANKPIEPPKKAELKTPPVQQAVQQPVPQAPGAPFNAPPMYANQDPNQLYQNFDNGYFINGANNVLGGNNNCGVVADAGQAGACKVDR